MGRYAFFLFFVWIHWLPIVTLGAAAQTGLMVVAQDGEATSVIRSAQLSRRVHIVLSEILRASGFDVYDETAACMEVTEPGRTRRKDSEIIATLRQCAVPAIVGSRPRPPIDALVLFELSIVEHYSKLAKWWIVTPRISGRVLSVWTGQHLGSFTGGDTDLPPMPGSWDEARRIEQVGLAITQITEGIGGTLSAKLAALNVVGIDGCTGRSRHFFITFAGFSREVIVKAEKLMRSFRCYRWLRPLRVDAARLQYYYATHASEDIINGNLDTLLRRLPSKGLVTKMPTGEYLITRVGVR